MEGPWLLTTATVRSWFSRRSMLVIGQNAHGRSHLNTAHFQLNTVIGWQQIMDIIIL